MGTLGRLRLRIVPIDIKWIMPDPATSDLCAHGGTVVRLGGEGLFRVESGGGCVSAAALLLLRTLEQDHTPENPIARRLIPCCGHVMTASPDGVLIDLGDCGSTAGGGNWWVRHRDGAVVLEFPGGAVVEVSSVQWRKAVIEFADEIEAFYRASPAKTPEPGEEQVAWDAFWAEWERRRGSTIR